MAITMNIYYRGTGGSARRVAEGVTASGTGGALPPQAGDPRHEDFLPPGGEETVPLIDSWEDQGALDAHHASSMMATIAALREKHDVCMTVERYATDEGHDAAADRVFVRE